MVHVMHNPLQENILQLMRWDERKFFGAPPGRTVKAHEGIGSYYRSDGEIRGALPYEYLKAKISFRLASLRT